MLFRSFGIRGLHERASTVGGWIDLSSGERGTTLILSIPLPATPGADPMQPAANARDNGAADRDASRDHDPSAWSAL